MTIKEHIEMMWALGITLEMACRDAQERFPHKCASRTYVMRIYRKLQMEAARRVRHEEEARCQSKD